MFRVVSRPLTSRTRHFTSYCFRSLAQLGSPASSPSSSPLSPLQAVRPTLRLFSNGMRTRQGDAEAKKQEKDGDGKHRLSNRPKDAATQGTRTYHNSGSIDATDCTSSWDDPEIMERNQKEYKKFLEDNRKAQKASSQEDHSNDSPEKKRGRSANTGSSEKSPNKKQKGNDGKQTKPSAVAGSITRVPKEGQQVQWHSLPGWVEGEVVEVLHQEKKVEGKQVKASKADPRIVLKSTASGKTCVHKPSAVHFD